MPPLALKPDSSFFRKIAIGAVGARAVHHDLSRYGHEIIELERGALDSKLWKEVKRKRVRIPDLLCTRCGTRIESRAKTAADLSMSHSFTEEARAWDFGMIDSDWIAFPVCEAVDERQWTAGRLGDVSSYWHERNWVRWRTSEQINYFTVQAFRSTPHHRASTKGVTEGSETAISWQTVFSSRNGVVESIEDNKVKIRRTSDNHRYSWRIRPPQAIWVAQGQAVKENQVIASTVQPIDPTHLHCPGQIPEGYIEHLLDSRERTLRFTGVKLAKVLQIQNVSSKVHSIADDPEEDVYVRLEGISYLASVANQSARALFTSYLNSTDNQTKLEAVITLGETATAEAIEVLIEILDDENHPYFIRSAAAWCLGKVSSEQAHTRLIKAFSDVNQAIREEALSGIASLSGIAAPLLLAGLNESNADIAAGCAEALRQQLPLSETVLSSLIEDIHAPTPSKWAVWLLGNIPREHIASSIADLQNDAPELHYAISVLWSFVESWIAKSWELSPGWQFQVSGNN